MRLENGAPGIGFVARARHAVCAISLHERAPVGLLVIGDLDHVDLDFEAEQRAGEGERRAPLSRAGFGRKPGDALFLVVESLGDRGVRLVAAGGAHALILIENARVRSERLLEPPRAKERRRAPHAVDVADRRRDFDMPLGADLLANERHREEGREVGGPDRLARARMQHRRRRGRQVGDDIVPGAGNAILAHDGLGLLAQSFLPAGRDDGLARLPSLDAVIFNPASPFNLFNPIF